MPYDEFDIMLKDINEEKLEKVCFCFRNVSKFRYFSLVKHMRLVI